MATNWAGNITYAARDIHRPTSLDELQTLVAGSERIRALGSRHSFTALPDSAGELVQLDALPSAIEVDADARSVSVGAGVTYGELAQHLHRAGWALSNWPRCRTSRSPARSRPAPTAPVTATGPSRPPSGPRPRRPPTASSGRGGAASPTSTGPSSRSACSASSRGRARHRAHLRGAPAPFTASAGPTSTSTSTSSWRRRTASASSPAGPTASPQAWVKSAAADAGPADLFGAGRRSAPCTCSRGRRRGGHRRSGGVPGPGTSGCRTSGWSSRPAAARSCRASTTCPRAQAPCRHRRPARAGDRDRTGPAERRDPHPGRRRARGLRCLRRRTRVAPLHLGPRRARHVTTSCRSIEDRAGARWGRDRTGASAPR